MTTATTTTTIEPAPSRLRALMRSARARVLLAFVVLLAFAAVLSTFLLRQVLTARTGERVDSALTQEVEELRRLVADGRDPRTGEPFGTDLRAIFDVFLARNVPGEGETIYTFLDGEPHRTSSLSPVPQEILDEVAPLAGVRAPARRDLGDGEDRLRALAIPIVLDRSARGVFAVTIDLGNEQEEVDDAVRTAAIVSGVALLLAALLGFVVTGRVLRPLREMTETARSITESDLTRRIPVEGDDEVAELGRTFNAMLDRLQAAFDSQRAFVSDAGHELRTPITIVRGHLELLGDDPAEREETMALVEDELARMTRLVEDLLTLAKSERTDFLQEQELDLDELTEALFAKAQPLGERAWELAHTATGKLRGDRQRITQAVMNLAVNAVQHTQPGDRIALGSALRGRDAAFWVADTGPGVPPADRRRIFERFSRGTADGRRTAGGSGLGLAITEAIAEAHGGRVEVGATPGGGATFTLTIPTHQEAP